MTYMHDISLGCEYLGHGCQAGLRVLKYVPRGVGGRRGTIQQLITIELNEEQKLKSTKWKIFVIF